MLVWIRCKLGFRIIAIKKLTLLQLGLDGCFLKAKYRVAFVREIIL